MTIPTGIYCNWTCTGKVISVQNVTEGGWRTYRIITIETDPGPIIFFDHNITHFNTIDSLQRDQVVTLSGIITPDNQARDGKSPYFLSPSTINVYDALGR